MWRTYVKWTELNRGMKNSNLNRVWSVIAVQYAHFLTQLINPADGSEFRNPGIIGSFIRPKRLRLSGWEWEWRLLGRCGWALVTLIIVKCSDPSISIAGQKAPHKRRRVAPRVYYRHFIRPRLTWFCASLSQLFSFLFSTDDEASASSRKANNVAD